MERVYMKQVLVLLAIALAFLLVVGALLHSQVYGQERDEDYANMTARERKIAKEMERKYFKRPQDSHLRFWGDTEIDEDEIIKGDMMVTKGSLIIAGEVEGNVIVLFGDVELDSTCLVDGDVVCVDGKIWRERGAVVIGDVIESTYRGKSKRPDWEEDEEEEEDDQDQRTWDSRRWKKRERPPVRQKKAPPVDVEDDFENSPCYFQYNRVDGLSLGLKLPFSDWWGERRHNFSINGFGAYGFASKKWRYQLGLERWISDYYRFTIGGEVHSLTDTQDRWVISDLENSLGAIFLKEDFQDYYNREGVSGYIAQNFSPYVQIRAEYHHDEFADLEKKTNWALFGGKKNFRGNPAALPYGFNINGEDEIMTIKSAVAKLVIDSRNSKKRPDRGWYIQAFGERAGHEFKSDIEFERFIVDIRRYQPLGWDENLDVRLRAGTVTGLLPPMYWYDLGGISTLRGFPFKEFTGDRMVLANVEYRLNAGSGPLEGWLFFDDFDLIFFVDSGYAWFANGQTAESLGTWSNYAANLEAADMVRPTDGFEDLYISDLKTCVGIGFQERNGTFRINIAKRTDIGGQPVVVTLRIRKSF